MALPAPTFTWVADTDPVEFSAKCRMTLFANTEQYEKYVDWAAVDTNSASAAQKAVVGLYDGYAANFGILGFIEDNGCYFVH